MSGLLAVSGVSFSTKRRTRYGLQEWTAILIEMCYKRTTAEAAARDLGASKKMPTGRWWRKAMRTVCPGRAEAFCGEMLGHTVHLAKRAGMRGGGDVLVAIDKHLIPRFDVGSMLFLVFAARKGGTNRFEAYATMQVVAGPINAVLDCVKFTRGMDNVDFVRRFVHIMDRYKIRPRLLLVDREFFAVDVMQALNGLGKRFLMPATKTPGIKRAILEHHRGKRDAVSSYVMRNAAGQSVTYRLAIQKVRKWSEVGDYGPEKRGGRKRTRDQKIVEMYVVFATNLAAARVRRETRKLPEDYRRRWGIETGYRQIEDVRPWTTSRDLAFRLMLFYTSLFMYNMWAIERRQKGANPADITLSSIVYAAVLISCSVAGVPFDPGGPG
ncbi:MAG: transposase [Desulfovibrionales bacterium]|nr:transposase [Desulfovibrionales bacterium]